jgi:glycine cleavage system T protein
MNKSPLFEIHKSLGATFTEVQGWEVPAHYGDPLAEHLAVRSNAGIMDMTHRGKIRVAGKDRTKFLQNILSQDMNALTPGTGGYAALLNTKGHMLAYMKIYSDEDSFLIDTEPGEADKIIQTLNRYLFREDVKIEDVTLKYGLVTLQGPNSRETICRINGTDIKEMKECDHLNLFINNTNCRVTRTTYTGEEGYDIYVPWDNLHSIWEAILIPSPSGRGAGVRVGITPFGHDAFETLRIEAGTPLYSVDMDEDTIPVEANLDHAISYTKGCYIGQETIARIKFKGHANKTLSGIFITGDVIPKKGDRVYKIIDSTEHDIGVITSACFSPTLNRSIAMGYIRIGQNEPGNEIHIKSSSHNVSAIISKLPFYQSSSL